MELGATVCRPPPARLRALPGAAGVRLVAAAAAAPDPADGSAGVSAGQSRVRGLATARAGAGWWRRCAGARSPWRTLPAVHGLARRPRPGRAGGGDPGGRRPRGDGDGDVLAPAIEVGPVSERSERAVGTVRYSARRADRSLPRSPQGPPMRAARDRVRAGARRRPRPGRGRCRARVPYEDDPRQGKDRPVLVVGYQDDELLAVPLPARTPRPWRGADEWVEVGSGGWDGRRTSSSPTPTGCCLPAGRGPAGGGGAAAQLGSTRLWPRSAGSTGGCGSPACRAARRGGRRRGHGARDAKSRISRFDRRRALDVEEVAGAVDQLDPRARAWSARRAAGSASVGAHAAVGRAVQVQRGQRRRVRAAGLGPAELGTRVEPDRRRAWPGSSRWRRPGWPGRAARPSRGAGPRRRRSPATSRPTAGR